MTKFNPFGAVWALEDYYHTCVPKKPIPPRYPGAKFHVHQQAGIAQEGQTRQVIHRKVGQVQTANLRSYRDKKDIDDDDDKEGALGTGESVEVPPDADSDFKSNVSQINYEMDDFNKNWSDEWPKEGSNSIEGRHHNTNNALPNAGQKSNVKSRLKVKNRWKKQNRNSRKKNGNAQHHHHHSGVNQNQNQNQNRVQQQQQARFKQERHMRFAYHSFKDNNMDQSPNALMNHNNNLQTISQNPQDMGHSSPATSPIDSVANLADSRTHNQSYIGFGTAEQPLNHGHAAEKSQVNTMPQPQGIPMELTSFDTDNLTVQQVARHLMLMMSTVRSADPQKAPEYFKNKKAMNAAGGECHKSHQPEGFN